MTPERLKAWRLAWNISQAKLADQLRIHQQTVAAWEQGRREIPPYLDLALETLERRQVAELEQLAVQRRRSLSAADRQSLGARSQRGKQDAALRRAQQVSL